MHILSPATNYLRADISTIPCRLSIMWPFTGHHTSEVCPLFVNDQSGGSGCLLFTHTGPSTRTNTRRHTTLARLHSAVKSTPVHSFFAPTTNTNGCSTVEGCVNVRSAPDGLQKFIVANSERLKPGIPSSALGSPRSTRDPPSGYCITNYRKTAIGNRSYPCLDPPSSFQNLLTYYEPSTITHCLAVRCTVSSRFIDHRLPAVSSSQSSTPSQSIGFHSERSEVAHAGIAAPYPTTQPPTIITHYKSAGPRPARLSTDPLLHQTSCVSRMIHRQYEQSFIGWPEPCATMQRSIPTTGGAALH